MEAAKRARRNTTVHMHDFYLPNDPFQDPCIGRRTGVPLNIRARKDSNGFDNIDDYFPDSDPEEENIVPNEQSADKDLLVARRTGVPMNINPRKDSKGFEIVDDYFPDSGADKAKGLSSEKGDNLTAHDNKVEDLPDGEDAEHTPEEPQGLETTDTPEGEVESPNDTGTIIKNPASREPTPQMRGPIKKRLSFTQGKSPTEPQSKKQMQSRTSQDEEVTKAISEEDGESDADIDVVEVDDNSQTDHQKPPNDHPSTAIKTKGKTGRQKRTNAKQKKNQSHLSNEDDEVIDVEGIGEEETFLTIGNTTRNAKSMALDKSPISAEAESFVMSESFVLEGTKHKTMSPEYASSSDSQPEPSELPMAKGKKSKIPVRKKGVPLGTQQRAARGRKRKMEEAVIDENENGGDKGLQNTKQEESKSLKGRMQNIKRRSTRGRQKKVEELQTEEREAEEALGNESDEGEVDVDVEVVEEESKSLKGRMQNTKRRSTRGRQKKVQELQNEEPEEEEAAANENDEDEDDKQVLLSSKQEQKKSSRRRTRNVEEVKLADSEAVKYQNSTAVKKGKRRAKSLPGTEQQPSQSQKSTRKAKKSEDVGDEELLDGGSDENNNIDNEQEEKRGRGRKSVPNTRQQQKKVTKGRQKKSDEDAGCKVVVSSNGDEGGDERKPASRESRMKKGVKNSKKQKQQKSVADGSDQAGGTECENGDGVKLSGRKTRAQRKKEEDAKLNREDNNREEREVGSGEEREIDDKDADVEVAVEAEPGQGEYECDEDDNVVENDRVQKLRTATQREGKDSSKLHNEGNSDEQSKKKRGRKSLRDQKMGQTKEQESTEEVKVVSQARKGEREKENEALEGQDEEQADDLNVVSELDEEETAYRTVSNISSVSSNASSGSESRKKAGTKRRKHASVLPPYARKASKAKSSKSSVTVSINSHDNTTESELRTDATKPRLDNDRSQTNFGGETSKTGHTTDPRKGERAGRTGRKKSVAQRNKAKESEVVRGKSVSAIQNTEDNEADGNASSFVDAGEACDEGDANYSVQEADEVEDRSFEVVPAENMTPTPFARPAKPATSLKSILKSGGSVKRTTTASRKRQMNADKSHSGGSDADDESVPSSAKQPNRKRLSTVSFASPAFVRASPEDLTPSVASKRSPLAGLSFVSKGSSYLSTDGTFTPGSGVTVRPSFGSASGVSSAGVSDIDPEEEVTITNDAEQVEDEQEVRRSKRTIVPPLQFWKNERIDYERRKSGGWCIKGVIRNPTPTPKIRRNTKRPKKPTTKKQNDDSAVDSSSEELSNEELDGFQEVTNPVGVVFNPENNEEVDMDIFHAPGMLNFTSPSGKPAQDDDPLLVHKFISQPLFGGGQVILRPGAEKGRQFVRHDTMVFYVIKGRIIVTVHQSSAVLDTGSVFFVPQGNSYNIKNLKQTDAKLMFVQIKG